MWLLAALGGSAFTIDTPTLQRALMVVPLLALLPAIFLDRVATRLALADIYTADWDDRFQAPGRSAKVSGSRSSHSSFVHPDRRFYPAQRIPGAHLLFRAIYGQGSLPRVHPCRAAIWRAQSQPRHGLRLRFADHVRRSQPLHVPGQSHHAAQSGQRARCAAGDGQRRQRRALPDLTTGRPSCGDPQELLSGRHEQHPSKPDGTPVVAVYHVTAAEIDG